MSWESFCCCGTVQCCPFTSVTATISSASARFSNIDATTGSPLPFLYRTQVSSVNTALATLTLNATIVKAHVLARHVVSGTSVPSCAYRVFNPSPTGAFGWVSGVPWTGASLVVDPDPTNPFGQKWIANSHRWVVFVETYSFSGGASGWEAGLRLEVRDTAFTGISHPLGSPPPLVFGRIASIVPNGCPTSLAFGSGSGGSSSYRGRIRSNPTSPVYSGGQQRAGQVSPSTSEQYIQYALTPPSLFEVAVS